MRNTLIVASLLFSFPAFACKDSFSFSQDKQKHFAVSAALGAGASLAIDNPYKAFGVAMIPGVAKEVYDIKYGCASFQDLLWDAIGAGIGVATTNVIIRHNFIGFKMELK